MSESSASPATHDGLQRPYSVYEDYEGKLYIIDKDGRIVLRDEFAYDDGSEARDMRMDKLADALNASAPSETVPKKLWLWKNFVDGRPEYWAFDNPFPTYGGGDPQTLGEPCGYAIFKKSAIAPGRKDVPESEVIDAIKRVSARSATRAPTPEERNLILWNDTRLRALSKGVPVRDLDELLARNSAYLAKGNPLE